MALSRKDLIFWKALDNQREYFADVFTSRIQIALYQSIIPILKILRTQDNFGDMRQTVDQIPFNMEPMAKVLERLYLITGSAFGKQALEGLKLFEPVEETKGGFTEPEVEAPAFDQSFFVESMRKFNELIGGQKIKAMSDTNRKILRGVIDKAIAEGWGVPETVKEMMLRYNGLIGKARARMIARTETMTSASHSTNLAGDAAIQNGILVRKRWIPTPYGKFRPTHLAMGAQPPILFENMFFVGGELMRHPHDINASAKNIINCRCALALVPL